MRGVHIDPEARTARAEAGVIWIEVVEAAAEHGLAALAGSSPDVGVVGYTLGGGLSWLARKHGLGANQRARPSRSSPPTAPSSAPTPTTSRTCSGRSAAAAARFGIVTAIEFHLLPITEVYAGDPLVPRRAREPRCCTPGAPGRTTCPTR